MAVAAYQAVAEDLRHRIEEGEFAPGDPLPSRADLSRGYGVGSNVAAAAVRVLVTEGLVKGRAGLGVFVRERPSSRTMARSWTHERLQGRLAVTGYGRDVTDVEGHSVRGTPRSTTGEAPEEIARRLGVPAAEAVIRSEYLITRDGRPAMFCVSWEPLGITGGTPVSLPGAGPMAGSSVVARMSYIGLRITRSTETVTARTATREEADVLDLTPGAPVAAIERTYYAGERPLETADLLVPGERFRLAYEIPAEPAEG
ncbi:GntR family transcriptional regulator [Streptomyces sp. IB2014 016-6]|uniref:GntR family transcriptional regulator n=1 Tax=Streptomyces sp. IB2014 016-6 TaxID=2517818 RepID=UPI0011CCD89F|nr:GntR family transcriptional regulator [Streptomyces sp. IB2014 016-6]TXL86600.1 GntR family transcriptional regulator [Streptomyces sp. IB2014 016-6]